MRRSRRSSTAPTSATMTFSRAFPARSRRSLCTVSRGAATAARDTSLGARVCGSCSRSRRPVWSRCTSDASPSDGAPVGVPGPARRAGHDLRRHHARSPRRTRRSAACRRRESRSISSITRTRRGSARRRWALRSSSSFAYAYSSSTNRVKSLTFERTGALSHCAFAAITPSRPWLGIARPQALHRRRAAMTSDLQENRMDLVLQMAAENADEFQELPTVRRRRLADHILQPSRQRPN